MESDFFESVGTTAEFRCKRKIPNCQKNKKRHNLWELSHF
ncbi:hypothetical protein LEP1GSC173_3075 [Leptospira interrogans str. HAI1594]|uniref:Uncharacterized protein n=6 Tax=Leptospira interrogans TaxID=173 RepID=A0A0E2DI82_LEPIR|nr:hypothetical protein G436_0747 [Leptospira interrogans serovar Hardjo str. Norma]EJP02235.1 hypothetical protein LEP1GSC007_0775 [Leptospira interrogans serovar Bulgarica str. Mallika]EJP15556.1 hypothetical protein LEP1GSC080_3543 [Leptospira interrogans str. FPW2026]EKO06996.1 hypothetical protein LEP1GSC077_4046 [Leptospira interrogans str. C10069]EKO27081.1 hypothetical protein LEP1GSC104_0955 [Leptospira interrogans str. UI 12621]EKO87206.1 hypothetical protein LEP1GSC009_3528 [Leptosp